MILILSMCRDISLFQFYCVAGIIIVGYFGKTTLFCKSINYEDSLIEETEFCIITGNNNKCIIIIMCK